MATSNDRVKRVDLQELRPSFSYLYIHNPKNPTTWVLDGAKGKQKVIPLAFAILGQVFPNAFVNVRMDDAGRHEYVSLVEAEKYLQLVEKKQAALDLRIYTEDEVKLMQRRDGEHSLSILAANLFDENDDDDGQGVIGDDMCPMQGGYGTNYNVIEELTLGPTQRFMLADAATLRSGNSSVPIFDQIGLVLNCHEHESCHSPGYYRVGGNMYPTCIFNEVHKIHNPTVEQMGAFMTPIQEEIWKTLNVKKKSVVSHCLAGLHRAPTMVVCHFLYRYYVLGMKKTCNNIDEIYEKIKRVRPWVAPLGYIDLILKYEAYLKARYPC